MGLPGQGAGNLAFLGVFRLLNALFVSFGRLHVQLCPCPTRHVMRQVQCGYRGLSPSDKSFYLDNARFKHGLFVNWGGSHYPVALSLFGALPGQISCPTMHLAGVVVAVAS